MSKMKRKLSNERLDRVYPVNALVKSFIKAFVGWGDLTVILDKWFFLNESSQGKRWMSSLCSGKL